MIQTVLCFGTYQHIDVSAEPVQNYADRIIVEEAHLRTNYAAEGIIVHEN